MNAMIERINSDEWTQLIRSVFPEGRQDRRLAILADVPDEKAGDHGAWRARRAMAALWQKDIEAVKSGLQLDTVSLIFYPNVHSNNADLPDKAYVYEDGPLPAAAADLEKSARAVPMEEILAGYQIFLAPTEFSATAPLKMLGRTYGFRAATMPGFSEAMIPALRLDYNEINRRVDALKDLLDPATGADLTFIVDGGERFDLHLDLRFRKAHASGGRLPQAGTAGNLPSGETYIVPYEGEKSGPSASEGVLPVQFGREIVRYRIERNKAVAVLSEGPASEKERQKISAEPAYSNIAELGLGVLRDFGVKPAGEILLDEKLGLHIAFGRSDHFGGAVGPKDFSSPEKVVHIDRIYIPETQPDVHAAEVTLRFPDQEKQLIFRDGRYTLF
jgi:hypothetical protein